jgi:hypothetical protein
MPSFPVAVLAVVCLHLSGMVEYHINACTFPHLPPYQNSFTVSRSGTRCRYRRLGVGAVVKREVGNLACSIGGSVCRCFKYR